MAGVKVGLVGIGLDTYWPQFEGLYDRLCGYQARIANELNATDATVVDAGLVDSPTRSQQAAELLRSQGVEMVFLFISTYALSSTVLPLAQQVRVPIVVLNLQPVAAIDYDAFNALGDRGIKTGEWLAHCQACCVPEIAGVFNRARIPYHLVTGHFESEESWSEVRAWAEASAVQAQMRQCRVGVLGHYYCGMLDVYCDLTQLSSTFGVHFELLEMAELRALRAGISASALEQKLEEFNSKFDVSPECSVGEIERAANTSCALDALVAAHDLGALAYYYEGMPGDEDQNIATSVIAGSSLLTAAHVPVAGECEVKNALAMKIMDSFDAGGSFSEFYAMDYKDDVVLLGHDGPAHFAISEGPVGLVPLSVYHGKPGNGLSIQMTVKQGPVTLLSVVQGADGCVSLLVAEGECVAGPVLQIGNTNSRYRFSLGAKGFVETWSKAGPAHHCAIGIGHIAVKLEKLADLIGIPCQRVC